MTATLVKALPSLPELFYRLCSQVDRVLRLVALAGAARHEARRPEVTVSHRGLKQFAAFICPARDRVHYRGVLLPQARPVACRTAIPFEPISALDRNQAAARPFH